MSTTFSAPGFGTGTFEGLLNEAVQKKLIQQFSGNDSITQEKFLRALAKLFKDKIAKSKTPTPDFESTLQSKIAEHLEKALSATPATSMNQPQVSPETTKAKFLRALAKLFKDKIAKPDFESTLQSKIAEHLEKTLINTASIRTDEHDISTAPSWIQKFMGIFSKLQLPKFDSVKPPKIDKQTLDLLLHTILDGLTPRERVKFTAKAVGYIIASPFVPLYFIALVGYQAGKILYPELQERETTLVNLLSTVNGEQSVNSIRELLDKLNAYFKPKEHNLILALRKAVEDLIERKKNAPDKVEPEKNKMLRFTFEDTSFAGQLKKRIKETLYANLMTDEVRIQMFIAKYENKEPPSIYPTVYNDVMLIENLLKQAKPSPNTELVEKYTHLRDTIIQAFDYSKLQNYVIDNEANFDAVKYGEYYESVTNLRELGKELKVAEDDTRNPLIQSKRILLLVCCIATDKESLATVLSILDNLNKLTGEEDQTIFYGQLLRLENEYPNYTAKSLQKYTDLMGVFNEGTGFTGGAGKTLASIFKIKQMDDVCAKVKVTEKSLKSLRKSIKVNSTRTADESCAQYFKDENLRLDNESTMYVSDLKLLKRVADTMQSTKKCNAKNIMKKIDDLIDGIGLDMSDDQKRANSTDTIASSILWNINNRLKSSFVPIKPVMSDKLKALAALLEKNKSKKGSQGQGNLTAPPSDSVTPNYEDVSGYDNMESDEPEGVPVATSINPATGKGYTEYPETAYVGNYFVYEFHKEQDQNPAKYASGPWVFKETFSVPPTVNKAPEKLIRKITVNGPESGPTIRIQHDKESGSLMDAGTVNKESMDKFYYAYFGKSRIIDAKKKKDKDSSMEYDEVNTQITRMKDALFELIERKKTTDVVVPATETPSAMEELKTEVENKIKAATKSVTQVVDGAIQKASNIVSGESEFTKKLKSEIETKLKSILSGETPGTFNNTLKSEIETKLKSILSGETPNTINNTLKPDIDNFTEKLKSAIQSKLTSMFSSQNPFLDTLKQKIQEKLTTTLTIP